MRYAEKLKNPKWQKKRLEILSRDNFKCAYCGDDTSTLHVHHEIYIGKNPWDTPDEHLITLCDDCHYVEHLDLTGLERCLLSVLRCRDALKTELVKLTNKVVKKYKGVEVNEDSMKNENPF